MEHYSNLIANEYSLNTKIYFQCNNWNFLKIYGPIFVEISKKCSNLIPVIVIPPELENEKERYLSFFSDPIYKLQVINRRDPLDVFFQIENVKLFIAVGTIGFLSDTQISTIKGLKTNIILLGYIGEEICYSLASKNQLDIVTCIAMHSEFWIDLLPEFKALYSKKCINIGYPEFDQLLQIEFLNKNKFLKNVGDKKIIVVSTANEVSFKSFSPKLYQFGFFCKYRNIGRLCMLIAKLLDQRLRDCNSLVTYEDALRTIRSKFPSNEFYIYAKTREKHRDPNYLRKYVDEIVVDESFYPFTTLELMKCANHLVSFYSSMVIEAMACGVSSTVLLHMPIEEFRNANLREMRNKAFYDGIWSEESGSKKVFVYNHASVSSWQDESVPSVYSFNAFDTFNKYFKCRDGASANFLNVIMSYLSKN